MFRRVTAALLGGFNVLNGCMMLLDAPGWYERTPGVVATGPFNQHFVMDIGAAFVATGLALLVRAWRPRYWPAAVAGCGFTTFHALIHIGEFVVHPQQGGVVAAIVLLAAFGLWAALPSRGEAHA